MESLAPPKQQTPGMLISPPTISIIVDDQDLIHNHHHNNRGGGSNAAAGRDTSNCATEIVIEQSNGSNTGGSSSSSGGGGMLKCHSMVNIKQQNISNSKKLLLSEFLDTTDSSGGRSKEMTGCGSSGISGTSYRKSLSRVNLNMSNLQLKPTSTTSGGDGGDSTSKLWYLELNDNNSKKSFLNAASPVCHNRAKLLLLNSPSSSSINKSMSNITKLVAPFRGGGDSYSNNNNTTNNESFFGQNNLLSPFSAGLDSPSTSGGGLRTVARLSVSRSNLFKSSSSLNALDIEGLDSVSVGSFDRQSLNSCGANSDDLDFLASNRRGQFDLTANNNNNNASTSIKKTSRSFNKKVLNWLNDI